MLYIPHMGEEVYIHYVFGTYKQRFVLTDPDVRSDLSMWFGSIAVTKSFEIVAHSILADHVHILIKQSQSDNSSNVMKLLKGISSRMFFKKYSKLPRWIFRKLWARTYKCWVIEESNLPRIISYIIDQRNRSGIDKRFNS